MLPLTTPCDSCTGTGFDLHHTERLPYDLQYPGGFDASKLRGTIDATRDVYGRRGTCPDCNGMRGPSGDTYARYRDKFDTYGQPYRSASALKGALTKGTATVCKGCTGTGEILYVPVLTDCYSCKGLGKRVTWDPNVDPVIPPEADFYGSFPRSEQRKYADAVTLLIDRGDGGMTWGESYLGLGSLWSCTDYGRAAESSDAEVLAEVREKLRGDHTQFVKLANKDDRRLTMTIIVDVKRNGYVVKAAHVTGPRPLLPPTYTPAAMARPV